MDSGSKVENILCKVKNMNDHNVGRTEIFFKLPSQYTKLKEAQYF